MTEKRPVRRMKFNLSLPAIGLVVLIILGNWFLVDYFRGNTSGGGDESLKNQAIEVAQQAVREKIGSGVTITFPRKAEVQVKSNTTYEVSSDAVTTASGGEPHNRPWIVSLQYVGDKGRKEDSWKVLSCNIGE